MIMNSVQDKSERRSEKQDRAIRHQELHDRLVDAAESAIAAGGLASLRARGLAEAVGAIYGVFADLDMLVLAVNARTLDAIDAVMQASGQEHPGAAGPADQMVRLALAYLDYAAANRPRWGALFQHRMAGGHPVPDWYADRQRAVFTHVEAPLAALWPGLPAVEGVLLARTVFAAVHGMVELGLDEKVAAVTAAALREQVRIVVAAMAAGLSAPGVSGTR